MVCSFSLYSQWYLHEHVSRCMQTGRSKRMALKMCFLNSNLKSLRQHTDGSSSAFLRVTCVSELLSLPACKMSCFSFTSCFCRSPQFWIRCIFTHPLWVATSTFFIFLSLSLLTCQVPGSVSHKQSVLFFFSSFLSVLKKQLFSWVTFSCLWPTKVLCACVKDTQY